MRTKYHPRCRAMLSAVFDGKGPTPSSNSTPLTVDCAPRSATIMRNGYNEADTWQMEFDARVLPFDPEAIASCAVRIYMWDSEGDETREWHIDAYERIRGLTDDIKLTYSDSDQMVVMSGRDYTAVLDGEWDPREKISGGMTIVEAVQFAADKAAPEGSSARFEIDFQAKDDDGNPLTPPVVSGSRRSTKKKGLWIKPGKTYWDVIYELCLSNGFIVFVLDSTIVITNPRTQSNASLSAAPKLVYGRNLMEMTASRKLAKEKVPRIILVYWDAKTRERFEVGYPTTTNSDEAKRQITTGLGLKKNEDMRIPAPQGVHDRDTALAYAKMRWDLMARAEAEYTFRTSHMTVDVTDTRGFSFLTGFGREIDLLALQAGDAIGVSFDPWNREHLRALTVAERVEAIRAQGYSSQVATFVAANLDRLDQFRQPYYLMRASFEYSDDDGLEIEVTAGNFASERREIGWADGTIIPDTITD